MTKRPSTAMARGALLALLVACGSSTTTPAERPAPVVDNYPYVAPDGAPVATSRQASTWVDHLKDDLLPYWTMEAAKGQPIGNFPTNRGMNGEVTGGTGRYVRMLSRQTFAYSVGFLVTGEPELLELAHAGARWILDRAWDETNGGWYQILRADGAPSGTRPKYAQDAAYAVLGLAAYYFVTRDPDAEVAILRTRDMLFDPTLYFDEETGRIKDGLDFTMREEVDQEAEGWELVAQLDPINAFMLLVQPVLSAPDRRAQFLDDLEHLSNVMLDEFFADGIFWGIAQNQGQYRTRHVDFGHNLKAFWMVREVDKRLPESPFRERLEAHINAQVRRAFDAEHGRWAKRPVSETDNEYGSDWWIYAEADQIAATLSLMDPTYNALLEQTQAGWLSDYVEPQWGEVIPNITRTGAAGWPWAPDDAAKCNLWKNGYHSMEHVLVMYLVGTYLEQTDAALYFAVPPETAGTFPARPYLLRGDEVSRSTLNEITIGERTLSRVRVEFNRLR